MSTKGINVERIRRFTAGLKDGDIAMLANAIEFCGSDTGFKDRLLQALDRAYDPFRKERLQHLVRALSEAELVWLCENHADIMHRR